jgi:hypothetical protein
MDSDDEELAELRAARAARQGGGAATLVSPPGRVGRPVGCPSPTTVPRRRPGRARRAAPADARRAARRAARAARTPQSQLRQLQQRAEAAQKQRDGAPEG